MLSARRLFRSVFSVIVLIACASQARAQSGFQRVGIDQSLGLAKGVVVSTGGETQLIFTSQIFPLDQNRKLVSEEDPAVQTRQVLANLARLLARDLHCKLDSVARLSVYVTSNDAVFPVRKEIANAFPGGSLPAVSYVVTPLRVPGAHVAVDAVAVYQPDVVPNVAAPSARRFNALGESSDLTNDIDTFGMPPDLAADYAGIDARRLILVSGQAEPGELRESIRKTWQSLEKTVEWAGGTPSFIAQVKVFMNSIDDVPVVFEEIAKATKDRTSVGILPAISFVQWTNKGATEIEVVAMQTEVPGSAEMEPVRHLTPPWMSESPVYCKVAVTNSDRLMFTSGLYGTPGADSEAEVKSLFADLEKIVKEAGSDLRHLAKATYYVANGEVSAQLNALRPKYYYPKHPPAASKASVTGVGVEGCTITLDMIAVPSVK